MTRGRTSKGKGKSTGREAGDGLLCPNCQSPKLWVKDSRSIGGLMRRRRVCEDCQHRATTCEVIDRTGDKGGIRLGDAIALRDQLMVLSPSTRMAFRTLLARLASDLTPPPESKPTPNRVPEVPEEIPS